ncbi:MAG TPA: hypothetical protein VN982_03220 [Candidatus Dormibacteraeota bacterium]|nr:hypothetical protein [Candidatus Dormibacteraeota bacterium]
MSGLPELPGRRTGIAEVLDSTSLRQAICDSALLECKNAFKNELRALISTGSLARDEASFLRKENSWAVCGDAEFMVVFEKSAALPAGAVIREIQHRIECDLLQRNIQCKIDLSAVHPGYFQSLPAHIFSYELKHCGRVIAGDNTILQSIPDYSAENLSLEDAWRLLCNRLVEMLECAAELSGENKRHSAMLRYKILKLYLDMGTSFLVFVHAYVPTYSRRRDVLLRLSGQRTTPGANPFELGSFANLVAECTAQKLVPGAASELSIDLSWHAAIQAAHALWRWELAQLVGAKTELTDLELFNKWISLQPFRKRVRGWLYVLRACGWQQSYLVLRRWLSLRKASPRHWVYFIAIRMLFQSAAEVGSSEILKRETNWATLSSYLPIRRMTAKNHASPSWEDLGYDVSWNYEQFVMRTRT